MSPVSSRCSSTVRSSNKPRSSGSTPMRRFNSSGLAAAFRPHTVTSPDVGPSNPVIICTVVDLPAPFGPRNAQIAPAATSRFSPFTAVNSPKRRDRLRQEIICTIVTAAATKRDAVPAPAISCHNFGVDVVLAGVQPEEIALNPAEAGAAGDSRIAASVEALFRVHYGRIVGMLTRLTGDRAHAEEIASAVFHKLSQRPALLDSREDLTAWIYRVATNAGCDALRTNWRRRKREAAAGLEGIHAAAAPSALDAMLAEERRERVRAVLGALKPREAQLLLLRSSGLAYREIAGTLGIEPASVGTMLARAEAEFERRFRARYGEHV